MYKVHCITHSIPNVSINNIKMKYWLLFILSYSLSIYSQESTIQYTIITDSLSDSQSIHKSKILDYYGGLYGKNDTSYIAIETPFDNTITSYSLSIRNYNSLRIDISKDKKTLSTKTYNNGVRHSIENEGIKYIYYLFKDADSIIIFSHNYGLLIKYDLQMKEGFRMINCGTRCNIKINDVSQKIMTLIK